MHRARLILSDTTVCKHSSQIPRPILWMSKQPKLLLCNYSTRMHRTRGASLDHHPSKAPSRTHPTCQQPRPQLGGSALTRCKTGTPYSGCHIPNKSLGGCCTPSTQVGHLDRLIYQLNANVLPQCNTHQEGRAQAALEQLQSRSTHKASFVIVAAADS
jgi:hypothetical protein